MKTMELKRTAWRSCQRKTMQKPRKTDDQNHGWYRHTDFTHWLPAAPNEDPCFCTILAARHCPTTQISQGNALTKFTPFFQFPEQNRYLVGHT